MLMPSWLLCVHAVFSAGLQQEVAIPSIVYSSLRTRAAEVRNFLGIRGMLAIQGVPGYSEARREALRQLTFCLTDVTSSQANILSRRLADGSIRRTVVAETREGAPSPMSTLGCPAFENTADVLRALVHMTVAQVLRVWEPQEPLAERVVLRHERGDLFDGLADATMKAVHLEHFHTYSTPSSADVAVGSTVAVLNSLDLHTDAGLLLVFTAPLYEGNHTLPTGLWVQEPDGHMHMPDLDPDSLFILVGEGAHWLPWSVRPVPHALRLPRGSIRAWYGMMIRLADDAVDPHSFNPGMKKQRTFGEWWGNETAILGAGLLQDPQHLGCRRMASADLTTSCRAGFQFCWMQCMPLPPSCNDSSALCVHTDGSPWTDQTEMCPTCRLTCPAFQGWDFCDSSAAVDMLMTGMRSYIFSDMTTEPCVILFFQEWVLDSSGKFALGIFLVFVLAVMLEAIAVLKVPNRGIFFYALESLLYVFRMTLAYSVMLCVMTFCVDIIVAVLLGLGVGHALFTRCCKSAGSLSGHTPCCSQGGSALNDTALLSSSGYGQIVLRVDGMTCQTCLSTVTRALQGVSGVVNVRVLLRVPGAENLGGMATVDVSFDAFKGVESLVLAIIEVGCGAEVLHVYGLPGGEEPGKMMPSAPPTDDQARSSGVVEDLRSARKKADQSPHLQTE